MRKVFCHVLALVLAILGLTLVLSAGACFDTARHGPELWPWLISQNAPGAEGAMYTLEDIQFKWVLFGMVLLVPGLSALAGSIWLFRRKREGNL